MKSFKYYKTTPLIILILVLAAIFDPLSSWLETQLRGTSNATKIFSYLRVLSTFGLITITLSLINNYWWKWSIFNWLIDIPDLNGRYEGKLVSSYKDGKGDPIEKSCTLEIKQTGSNIHILSYYGDLERKIQTSMSYSVSETLIKDKDDFFKLYYVFSNEPDTLEEQLNNHDGTAKLKYFPDINTLKGEYYNKRQNVGTIEVSYSQDEIIGRLMP